MAAVIMENIAKRYPGAICAVRELSLEIRDGEFLVLVGPSGCGKSTTLRMVAGLETISEGTLKIGNQIVNGVPPRDRDVALVFQNDALYPHLTVRENLAFALKLRRTARPEIEARVLQTANLLNLAPLLDRKPHTLSGGQRQRVALGRAIVRRPAVFLFDEPLSNLDAQLRVEMRIAIKRLHRKLKATTIYVTHDQEEALTLGDRVVVMCDGAIRQVDTPLAVYNRPADRFVAGFLGLPSMNFIAGQLQLRAEQLWFTADGLQLRLTDAARAWLGEAGQRAVVAGIRPEDVSLATAESPGFTARVEMIEPRGGSLDVHLQTPGGIPLVCQASAGAVSPAATVRIGVSAEKIHLFEPDVAGKSIPHVGQPVA